MIVDSKTLDAQTTRVEQSMAKIKHLTEDQELFSWYMDDYALRFCWSSNAIEGSTLSLDETVALVEFDEVRAGHTYAEYHDAKNLYRAICTSMIPFQHTWITEDWIKKNNQIIMGDIGGYRDKNVRIGNLIETSHTPPDFSRVPDLMASFLDTVNFSNRPLFEAFKEIAIQHMTFERIHPFADGNGRTGRMVLNQQLINHNLLPVSIAKKSAYMQALRQFGRNGDYSKMVHELLKAEEEAIDRLIALEKKRDQGLKWTPKSTLEEKIKAAGNLQANSVVPAVKEKIVSDQAENHNQVSIGKRKDSRDER